MYVLYICTVYMYCPPPPLLLSGLTGVKNQEIMFREMIQPHVHAEHTCSSVCLCVHTCAPKAVLYFQGIREPTDYLTGSLHLLR